MEVFFPIDAYDTPANRDSSETRRFICNNYDFYDRPIAVIDYLSTDVTFILAVNRFLVKVIDRRTYSRRFDFFFIAVLLFPFITPMHRSIGAEYYITYSPSIN